MALDIKLTNILAFSMIQGLIVTRLKRIIALALAAVMLFDASPAATVAYADTLDRALSVRNLVAALNGDATPADASLTQITSGGGFAE